ncbi:unnamed protein product [Prunus armeniaca]|uniref:Retrotransposon Copia-like N-terminal domain-containing protein n=1 Tax=Prunus armeniaca TaxID=36596 RepID=A0A6J5VE63_PRUAR|nr:unnamed protein product [Prunus armeniaca]
MAKDDESIVASNIAYVVVQSHNMAREKMGYIRGKEKAPPETNPKYDKWYVENQKVKSWLLTSMTPEIMKCYISLKTTSEIWDALSMMFFDGTDEIRVFALSQKAFAIK